MCDQCLIRLVEANFRHSMGDSIHAQKVLDLVLETHKFYKDGFDKIFCYSWDGYDIYQEQDRRPFALP